MNKEKIGIPKLRFPGFTGAWEQRKLGEIGKVFTGNTPSTKNTENWTTNKSIGHVWITPTDINNNIMFDSERYLSDKGWSQARVVPKNSVLITSIASIGKNAINGVEVAFNQQINALVVQKNNPYFILTLMNKEKQRFESLAGQTATPIINKSTFSSFMVKIPSETEQKQIGDFFKQLDSLIALHQRKLEHLKRQKNGLLQKMFPKNDESVPDVRFPGFTDPWEQRRLGEYYEFKNGLNKGKEFFGDGTPIVNFVDVFHNRGLISRALGGRVQLTPKEISNYEVKKGDLFFTRTSETIEEIGYPSVMLDNPHNTVFSGFVLRGRCVEESDPLENIFKKYVFFTDTFRQEMMKKSSMTTRALTSGTALKSMLFRFPVSRVEQRKIGELITKLDSLIALYQRKLEHLELLKKGLLQQMFV